MKKILFRLFIPLLLIMIVSCSGDSILKKMEHIKEIGDEAPEQAMAMLDSLELEVRDGNEYVQKKYDLLKIRLTDKAMIPHTSDVKIKELVGYFEKEGTLKEKQEAFYYAGSVYRDLQDTPRALENFLHSVEYAKEETGCDSLMLRNAYSNLSYLQFRVQNFEESISMGEEELNISNRLGITDVIAYLHIGAAYKAGRKIQKAVNAYDKAYQIISSAKDKSCYQEGLIRLLYDYSALNKLEKARVCKSFIAEEQSKYLSVLKSMALAQFYQACGKRDSAIFFYQQVLNESADINNRYDASKQLYCMYAETGEKEKAFHYAGIYMQLSDSLDFGERQEQASTVNNAFKYYWDESKERTLLEEKERYQQLLIFLLFLSFVIVTLFFFFYIRKRNAHIKRVIEMSSEVQRLSYYEKQLCEELESKEKALKASKEKLEQAEEENKRVMQKLDNLNFDIKEFNISLKEKENMLSEKLLQNKKLVKILHQSDFVNKSNGIVLAIKQSEKGMEGMTSKDWEDFCNAVEVAYPKLKKKLSVGSRKLSEQQIRIFYLLHIGLTNTQILSMTKVSRATLWRLQRRYEAIMASDNKS